MSRKILAANLIKDILSKIREIVQTTRNPSETTYRKGIEGQLKENNYDYFEDATEERQVEDVIKILALAINDIFVEKFDLQILRTSNREEAVQQLGNRLGVRKSIDDCLLKKETDWSSLAKAQSPLDFAKFLKKNESVFVTRLIQHQYQIKWATKNGRPNYFTLYDFCNNKQTEKYLQYAQRSAHTKVTLYQECSGRAKRDLRFSKEKLCPDVYMKTTKGWVKWMAEKQRPKEQNEGNFEPVRSLDKDLKWMHKSIRDFVNDNADETKKPEESLEKATLYLTVIKDEDFPSEKESKLNKIGECQGYVGKANKGIRGRWINDGHCNMMKTCLDNVNAMTTYEPLRLQGIPLVDVRLALAKVREENCALFVMKTFGDEKEKAEILRDEAKKEVDKADEEFQGRLEKKATELKKTSATKQLQDAEANVKKTKDLTREEAESKLIEIEKEYRECIRLSSEGEETVEWKLKEMEFGMNNK